MADRAAICVAQFESKADAAAKLVELKAANSYDRDTFVEKGGWSKMPGEKEAVRGVARLCADTLNAKTAIAQAS